MVQSSEYVIVALRSSMASSPSLSVVIPAYRQANTIVAEIRRLHRFLADVVPQHEIILVIDGNEDQTLERVTAELSFPELRVECFTDNQGKGMAVRHGMQLAKGELIAFMDAGGDLLAVDLLRMMRILQEQGADLVIGSKKHIGSHVTYPLVRRLYSSMYQLLNRLLFNLTIRDTQVGMKIFRRDVLQQILPRLSVKRFAFDLELLVVAHHLGFNRIVEAPVTLQYQFSSSINRQAVYQILWDTLAIFYRSKVLRWYDRTPPSPGLRRTGGKMHVPLREAVAIEFAAAEHIKRSEQQKVKDL